MSSQLCQQCSDILLEYDENNSSTIYRQDVPFTSPGCAICANTNKCLLKGSSLDVIGPLSPPKVSYEFSNILRSMSGFSVVCHTPVNTLFSTYAIMPLDNHALRWTEQISADTLSPDAILFLRLKLKKCLDTHTDCRHHTMTRSSDYPTRLLDLSSCDGSKVSLKDTACEACGPYFTLSHCWGASQPLKLTRNTEQSLRNGVEINTLPKTFRHAIDVCRQLGIDYLWIDSMCIFQDDLTDWHSQAASMRQVYASALCNIAATSAPDSSHGLRFHRDVNAMRPFTVALPRRCSPFPMTQTRTYVFFPNLNDDGNVPAGHLTERAWVLQENILSRRIMHFTSLGVYWECLTNVASDLYPDGMPNPWLHVGSQSKVANLKKLLLRESGSDNDYDITTWKADIYNGWNGLSELYSGRKITYASDKLVALNGIAREVASKTGDLFLCGLWKQMLLPQLLWVNYYEAPGQINKEWRAPTWSWAQQNFSIAHPTHMPCTESRERASVDVVDVGAFPSGQLQYASLTLRGRIVYATFTVKPVKYREKFCQFSGPSESTSHYLCNLFLDSQYRESLFHAQVVCIALYEDLCEIGLRASGISMARLGILVMKQCQSEPVKYERVGVLLLSEKYCDLYTAHETEEEHSITII